MLQILFRAIRAHLLADSAIVTALGGEHIYALHAPPGQPLPYMIVSLASGGSNNRTPRDEIDITLTVKCVADSAVMAVQLADLIRVRLHDTDLTLDPPWAAYRCQQGTPFIVVEHSEHRRYWHAGGNYRVRAVSD